MWMCHRESGEGKRAMQVTRSRARGGNAYAGSRGCRRLIRRDAFLHYCMHSRRWCGSDRARATYVGVKNAKYVLQFARRCYATAYWNAYVIPPEILHCFRRKLTIGWKITTSRTRSNVVRFYCAIIASKAIPTNPSAIYEVNCYATLIGN